ncbi:hypothetical protein E8E13_004296 [Curvularia kusanoi]|uniref:Cell wall protein PhiA n=1 Tax=Curvularia kusanoi TaxID=90978 RepID=A0A9P4TH04_CURKU|nr:hypothetical protein E8E13_004296 [Curvularia kusanoi]
MKFTTAAIAASAAALVSATPIAQATPAEPIKAGEVFSLLTIRSGSDFQYSGVQAKGQHFKINDPAQNASCAGETNTATFYLTEDGELFLNTAKPSQQAYVNRSGMGQGIMGYTTGVQPVPKNSEQKGFALDENNNLVFKDQNQSTGFVACPNALGGGYSVWLAVQTNPGGNEGCLGFTARAIKEEKPVYCSYSQ